MATTTGTLVIYESWFAYLGNAANLDTDTFKIGLTTSSYTPNAATHALLSDITNECSGSGYSRQTIDAAYTQTGGVGKFDFADPVFTASTGSIVARYYFIYDDTVANDPLVCYGLLDQTPADVTTTDGNTLTLNIDAAGLFTIALAV